MKGKNKPVTIKYETKIKLVKNYKQKGGNRELLKKYYERKSLLDIVETNQDKKIRIKKILEDEIKVNEKELLEAYRNNVPQNYKNNVLNQYYQDGKRYTNENVAGGPAFSPP